MGSTKVTVGEESTNFVLIEKNLRLNVVPLGVIRSLVEDDPRALRKICFIISAIICQSPVPLSFTLQVQGGDIWYEIFVVQEFFQDLKWMFFLEMLGRLITTERGHHSRLLESLPGPMEIQCGFT